MSYDFFNEWSVKFTRLLMADFGFSALDCHAIMGNLGEESGGFLALQERKPLVAGSKGGYGIAQWTGPRRRAYEAYCARNKLDPADMMTNYKYLFVELSGDEKASVSKVKDANTLETKTEAFMKGFLRPGIPHLDVRIQWAKRAQVAWSNAGSTEPDPVVVPKPPEPANVPTPIDVHEPKERSLLTLLVELLLALFGKK